LRKFYFMDVFLHTVSWFRHNLPQTSKLKLCHMQ